MREHGENIQEQLLNSLDLSRDLTDEELEACIADCIREYSHHHLLSLQERAALERRMFHSLRRLDILQDLLDDPEITEIMVNGGSSIFYEKAGRLHRWEGSSLTEAKLSDIIQQIVGGANRTVNEAQPIVDARLPDGSRVNVVLSPVSVDGSAVSIRRFPKEPMTLERLLGLGSLSDEVAELLVLLVKAGYNIFVSGGTGSGKTTFLNALSEHIPPQQRVVTIEDSAELQLFHVPNLVRLETRNSNGSGAEQITIRDLIRTALRMRPDRIIVGEVRGAEALDMLQSLNTGHDGSLSTGHANSSEDMLSRLETMVLMGMPLPIEAIRRQIASGVDIFIHLGRLRDKSRKVLRVAEVCGMENGEVRLQTLYQFKELTEKEGRVYGIWEKKKELANRGKLATEGLSAAYEDFCKRYTEPDWECASGCADDGG